ncbi:MAG: hypothetical protein ACREAX_00350 [Candidatus Nitrosotenuis sp.]
MQTSQGSKKISEMNITKIYNIAEILGILDETNRGKDWLLEEIKKHHVKILLKPTMNSFEILKECPTDFVSQVVRALKGDDIVGFEDVKTLTRTYHWFFTDIVAGSNPAIPTKDQVRKIIVLNELISRTSVFANRDPNSTVILPTGDGMAIGYSDSPEKPLRMSIELHKALARYNETKRGKEKLLIRIGIDIGPVYVVKDLNGKDNVWGPGLILTRRVMDLAGDMQILASERIANDIRSLSPEYKEILHPIGDYFIKHGEKLKLYNIYGEGFGNKIILRKNKALKSTLERDIKNVNNFSFNKIEVILDVKDLKTLMTHHTWVWNVVNISKEPKSQIFYYLDGDAPRDFPDMNVTIHDENGNNLEILSVNVNKPLHKEFVVQMNRPIKPKQKKILRLEYDWEEPTRNYFYRFASNCKEFSFLCMVPRGLELKNRILKVDTETGYKMLATPPASVKRQDDVTAISWGKENLKAYDAYQFEW